MKKQIPNIITLLNLLCGILSVFELLYFKNFVAASCFIVLGAVFDFFDGMTARLLGVSSPIGKELDSLSDVVTFGVAPSLIAFMLLNPVTIIYEDCPDVAEKNEIINYHAFVPLLMALFSSYRLAKFNLDTRQSDSFIGLATPANAFLWLSIPLIELQDRFHVLHDIMVTPYFIIPVSIICCVLLVSEIPMFSLKFHNLKWTENQIRFIFLILSAILLVFMWFAAIPVIIILYIILSIINNIINKQRNEISSSN
ncbi:MAG: CDP-alcohol phosphatidyltransferase family protein [Bacteroidales bacterium]|nr:CDP-alcohol phosphatidyltransferase family protein [Bacteroidales bacterium]